MMLAPLRWLLWERKDVAGLLLAFHRVVEHAAKHVLGNADIGNAEPSERLALRDEGYFLGTFLHGVAVWGEVDKIAAAIVGIVATLHEFGAFHGINDTRHGRLVLINHVAKGLLRDHVLLRKVEKHGPLLGRNAQAAAGEVALKFAVDGRKNLSVENGKYQADIKIHSGLGGVGFF